MNLKSRKVSFLLYTISGLLGVSLAFLVASYWLNTSKAQTTTPFTPSTELVNEDSNERNVNQQQESQNTANEVANAPTSRPEAKTKGNIDLILESYNYDPTSRRDPFVPIKELVSTDLGMAYGPRTQTENFDVSQFKLIGVIWNVNDPKAMFMDPNKKVHVLKKNQRIGRNQGYIAAIREGEVVVVETSFKSGEPVYTAKVVKLSK